MAKYITSVERIEKNVDLLNYNFSVDEVELWEEDGSEMEVWLNFEHKDGRYCYIYDIFDDFVLELDDVYGGFVLKCEVKNNDILIDWASYLIDGFDFEDDLEVHSDTYIDVELTKDEKEMFKNVISTWFSEKDNQQM